MPFIRELSYLLVFLKLIFHVNPFRDLLIYPKLICSDMS